MFTGLGGYCCGIVDNVAGRYWKRIEKVDSSGSALLILITCFLSLPRMSPRVMLDQWTAFSKPGAYITHNAT